jgi:hypothetical protein
MRHAIISELLVPSPKPRSGISRALLEWLSNLPGRVWRLLLDRVREPRERSIIYSWYWKQSDALPVVIHGRCGKEGNDVPAVGDWGLDSWL